MRAEPPSPRVRLEVAILDADEAPMPAAPVPLDDPRLTVLVVAAETDVRRYVRECLRARADLRLLEAATVPAAVAVAIDCSPALLVVDESESDVLAHLSQFRAIVIVDDVRLGAPASGTRVRRLVRPFTADGLLAEVDQVLE